MKFSPFSLSTPSTHAAPFTLSALACLVLVAGLPSSGAAEDAAGYIYGTVDTEKGRSYTGIIRWDDEEAFWSDHFNGTKTELPHLAEYGKGRKAKEFEVFGKKINVSWGSTDSGRQFVVYFGDIRTIEIEGHDEATVTMKDGTQLLVESAGNDMEADLFIQDDSLGEVEIPWKSVAKISFRAAPENHQAETTRLIGTVSTENGRFSGPVQWDRQECVSTDELDGEEDGVKHSIRMGKIASIEREGKKASNVTLRDGRRLVLEGTNDVDDDNRGILVNDDRFGIVEIPWTSFDRVDFDEPGPSGRPYDSFRPGRQLRGTVTTNNGQRHTGRLIYDLDEAYTWEFLDGRDGDLSFAIPFGSVRVIERTSSDEVTVTLRDGAELDLADTQDVSDANDGVLVLGPETDLLIEWDQIDRVELDG